MNNPGPRLRLQAGGLIRRDRVYIERPQDAELLQLLLDGEFCNVLTPRQMGKSSLMARTAFELQKRGVRSAVIELAGGIGSAPNADEWYLTVLKEIARSLKILLDVEAWWNSLSIGTHNQKLLRFFQEIAGLVENPLVIFFDEIDATLELPYTDDLFAAFRAMYNERTFIPAYDKVTVCLLGVATPNELIKQHRKTPYNIGHTIELRDFCETADDLSQLAAALNEDPEVGWLVLRRILHWTDGHPYLTVRFCEDLSRSGAQTPEEVDSYVDRSFSDLDRLTSEVHFEGILRFLSARVSERLTTLRVYERIVAGIPERDQANLVHAQLKLSGLVKRDATGHLIVRNRLYARLFDANWIQSVKPPTTRSGIAAVSILGVLILLTVLAVSQRQPSEILSPTVGLMVERQLPAGESRSYSMHLEAGQYVQLTIDQLGIDVVVALFGPSKTKLIEVDSPNGSSGSERLSILPQSSGHYSLKVRAAHPGGKPGRYRIKVEKSRRATFIDHRRWSAQQALATGQAYLASDSPEHAISNLTAALRMFQTLGDYEGQNDALDRLAQAYRRIGMPQKALALYRMASPLEGQEARTQFRQGELLLDLDETSEALAHFQRAYSLWIRLQDRHQAAAASSAIGDAHIKLGDFQLALQSYDYSLEVWGDLGETSRAADLLTKRSKVLYSIGDRERAIEDLQRALDSYVTANNLQGQVTALSSLGQIYFDNEEQERARELFIRALDLTRRLGHSREEALTLANLGASYKESDPQRALALFREASDRFSRLQDQDGLALMLNEIGEVHNVLGQPAKALDAYRTTLAHWRTVESPTNEADALYGIARAERSLGRTEPALIQIQEAIGIIEKLKYSPTLRSSQSARRQEYFDFYIDLLMDLHALKPSAGYDAAAFGASERYRTDLLSTTLQEAKPRLATSDYPVPLTAQKIQALVLDRETILLEYKLGAERSFLWIVTSNAVHSHILPGRTTVERAASRAYQALSQPGLTKNRLNLELSRLSEILLSPSVPLLEGKRLLVVTDGALEAIPFAALPSPTARSLTPLITTHEVVSMPSASTLGWLRRKLSGRQPAPGALAVLADPVFDGGDPRLRRLPYAEKVLANPVFDTGDLRLHRLPYAEKEAQYITSLVPPGQALLATGFLANRSTVLSGDLARYRILHFATHGVFINQRPGGQALVLSLIDENGLPQDGLLHSYEISNLDLPAELVVLSASETAFGIDASGSGITALTQGFMYAGAKSVVGSLWNINDQATAVLMDRFYKEMLGNHRRPAEALRLAQVSMLRDQRWQSPYYWAGFTFQGEWH